MTIDMHARRDAFLMLTDERAGNPKRWLLVWDEIDYDGFQWTEWAGYDDRDEAYEFADLHGLLNWEVHDLDAQS